MQHYGVQLSYQMIVRWHPDRVWRALSACWQSGHGHWRPVDFFKRTACFWFKRVPVW